MQQFYMPNNGKLFTIRVSPRRFKEYKAQKQDEVPYTGIK